MQPDFRFLPPGLGASLSRAVAHDLEETGIAEVAMAVFGDPDVVPLWFGEGDLVTPDFVREAAASRPAGRRDLLHLAARPARAARGARDLYRAAVRHRLRGRAHLGHDRRHAGDPAELPAAARSRATTS